MTTVKKSAAARRGRNLVLGLFLALAAWFILSSTWQITAYAFWGSNTKAP
ncbi:MAG: hypothetical protein U0174_20985 [Polyangiaceae bacterium]